ncbi:hypothetical protein pb186bvf_002705 [Paramecium bursaria]
MQKISFQSNESQSQLFQGQQQNRTSPQQYNDHKQDDYAIFFWDYKEQSSQNQESIEDRNKTKHQKSNKNNQREKNKEKKKQQQARGNEQNLNNQDQQYEELQLPLYDNDGLSNIEHDSRENVPTIIALNNCQSNIQEQSGCPAQIKKQRQKTQQQQQEVNPHKKQNQSRKQYKKQKKQEKKAQNQVEKQIPQQNQDEDQQYDVDQFQQSPNLSYQERIVEKVVTKIVDITKKLDKRWSQIDPTENSKSSIQEDNIQEYFRNINWPQKTNIQTISYVLQIFSRIKKEMESIILQKKYDISKGQDGFYILKIIMAAVRYNYYKQLTSDNYELEKIQWIHKLRDDLRHAFKKVEVQVALEHIYCFILNDEQIPQDYKKTIKWRNLVEDVRRKYLGYQQNVCRNIYKSFVANYYIYIEENPHLKQDRDFEQSCYDLQIQRKQNPNKPCGKEQFENFDKQKLKSFLLNDYMKYYLNNKQRNDRKVPAIQLDSIFNLIVDYERF